MPRLSLLLSCLLLSACAAMNESECITADWQLIGYEDGAEGRNAATLSKRRQACAKHGITPVMSDYRLGYQEGLQRFCTAFNGFQKGSRGYQYQGVCRESSEAEFLTGYRDGQELYGLQQAVNEIGRRINHKQNQIDRLEKDISLLRQDIISDKSTPEQREQWLDEIGAMEYEIGVLVVELEIDHDARAIAEEDYQIFRSSLPY